MRILIVEDDVDLMHGYAEVLEHAGHTTIRCSSFDEARAAMRDNPFDAIVTDVRLGDRNGLGLLIAADAIRPGARKVVMSGFDDPVLRRDASELGASYLLKPIDPATLVDAVQDNR